MAIFGQNYSYGYNTPGIPNAYTGFSAPPVYGGNVGALTGGGQIQQLLSGIQQMLGVLQQLQGTWQGLAGFQSFNPYQAPPQANPYGYNFTPYVPPISFPNYGPYYGSGPIVPDNRPSALSPAGMGSA